MLGVVLSKNFMRKNTNIFNDTVTLFCMNIQQDIYSFGNLGNGKEYLLQIYPPLSHFDHFILKAQDY
jgi:hypothetical protein